MDVEEQIRLPIPANMKLNEIQDWCREWLNDRVKIKYYRKQNKQGKWVRDYTRKPVLRFINKGDAVAFKIYWTEK